MAFFDMTLCYHTFLRLASFFYKAFIRSLYLAFEDGYGRPCHVDQVRLPVPFDEQLASQQPDRYGTVRQVIQHPCAVAVAGVLESSGP